MVYHYDIPRVCAKHMIHSYGTAALRVAELGEQESKRLKRKLNERIVPEYPFLRSELLYAIKHELAEKPNDVLCRRVPLAIIDKKAALEVLPEVVDLLARERRWSSSQKKQELEEAVRMMEFMK